MDGLAACLDILPYRPCGDGDRDCDGWPAVGVNPMASDCDDDNVLVNPGAEDDPGTDPVRLPVGHEPHCVPPVSLALVRRV